MKIFISWSGPIGHEVASALRTWLPYFIQALKPFLSSVDIVDGARWSDALSKELEHATLGIICVTPFNFQKVWLNFEAGALSRNTSLVRVVPLLFRTKREDISGPLLQFQSALLNRDDFLNLLYSINNNLKENEVEHSVLTATFEQWWPKLEDALNKIPLAKVGETRTAYPWLLTTKDLIELAKSNLPSTKCIWIISRGTQRLTGAFEEAVHQNLKLGVTYRFFAPTSIPHDERAELDRLENSSDGKFMPKYFDALEFSKSAATDYVIFNPILNGLEGAAHRKMFLRLPIESSETEHWVDVEEAATVAFVERFAALWNEHDSVPSEKSFVVGE